MPSRKKDFVAQEGGPGHRKDGVPKTLCGSVRWSRHRKDGVPKNTLWLSKVV